MICVILCEYALNFIAILLHLLSLCLDITLLLVGLQGSGLSMKPNISCMKGHHLKEEMKLIVIWRETWGLLPDEDDSKKMEKRMYFHIFSISFLAFSLWWLNNIIEPSCAYYANALGSSNALSGLMIGLAPWFAIISAVSYSVWLDEWQLQTGSRFFLQDC
jgi:hypothetical protein